MSKAVILQQISEKQILKTENVEVGKPGKGQMLVKNIAVGINEDDIYINADASTSRVIPGYNASGEIVEIGADVSGFSPGDSVVYLSKNMGCYQESCLVNVNDLIALPETMYHKTAGAAYFAGMTVHALAKRVYLIRPKIISLVHNVTSGIGHILAQWANSLGAIVIGTVDNDDKKNFALTHGCHEVLNHNSENWDKEVMQITKNYGVNVVYDSLGSRTFNSSIKCLTKMGIMVCYGRQSQSISTISIGQLSEKSLYITCPSVFDYKPNKMELLLTADEVFAMISSGRIKVSIDSEYSLDNIEKAHQKLRDNQVTGVMVANV